MLAASYNVQLVEQQHRCYPNYYQSATISEIDEPTENAAMTASSVCSGAGAVSTTSAAAAIVASVLQPQKREPHQHLPVQASPVLVLHDQHDQQRQQQLRQKALVDSVESKV